ncbi:MAG: acyl-CoA thioesterase [Bacteroidaceae bacterium]|nr:acyl-CoA thioesterase [Bacteroidaceae bacterium]MDE7166759.1 acyl-CoA thioesterase [Bacteroidaceae bacterium]
MTHEIRMKVRDYECDLQGIVNNANYQHYTEHARHEMLLDMGVSFADLHRQGIDVVVARITLSYKKPLRSDDEFIVRTRGKKEGIRYVFYQDILRLPDEQLACRAKVDIAAVVNGVLATQCPILDNLLVD